jgi:predicted ATP-dependent serine protease
VAAYGEVGLAGEVRGIPFESRRVEELDRMGVTRRISPGAGEPIRLLEALRQGGLQ